MRHRAVAFQANGNATALAGCEVDGDGLTTSTTDQTANMKLSEHRDGTAFFSQDESCDRTAR